MLKHEPFWKTTISELSFRSAVGTAANGATGRVGMPPIRERELTKPPVGHLLVLFIAVPVVELALLIEIGQRVGTVGTIGLIMGTGIVGASLARQQGISTLARLRADLDAGRWPAEQIVDGVLILVAAAVLRSSRSCARPSTRTGWDGRVCVRVGISGCCSSAISRV